MESRCQFKALNTFPNHPANKWFRKTHLVARTYFFHLPKTGVKMLMDVRKELERFSKDKHGQIGPLGLVIPLVLVFGLAIVIAIIMSTVAAQTYTSSQPWIGINNATISADVNSAVENSFEAYNQATSQLDLLAIIAVAFVVISAVVMFMRFGNPAGGGGML